MISRARGTMMRHARSGCQVDIRAVTRELQWPITERRFIERLMDNTGVVGGS